MRLHYSSDCPDIESLALFAKWILDIGDGKVGEFIDGELIVQIPDDILVKVVTNPIGDIVDVIYPDLLINMFAANFFSRSSHTCTNTRCGGTN
jgi:hypothetical protein